MPPELTPDAWAQIRYDYEHTERPITDICAEHGISDGTLRDRVRRWRWARRRAPIPRQGPPAMMVPRGEISQCDFAEPSPWPLDPRFRGDERREANAPALIPTPAAAGGGTTEALPLSGGETPAALPPMTTDAATSIPADSDPAAIVPRLQSAVARVLPAIEAAIAKLGSAPMRPREMEQAARALGALMRTLRELNNLLSQRQAAVNDDRVDIDAFRFALARRIEALIAARTGEAADGAQPDGASAPS